MAPKSLFGSLRKKPPPPPPSRDDSPRRPEHVGSIFDRLNARRRSVSFSSAPRAMLQPHHGASVLSLPRVLATPPQLPQLQFSRAEDDMMEAPLSPMSPQLNRAPEIVVSPPTAEETGRGKAVYEFFRCEIFATSEEDHREAESECRQIIVEAGGEVIEDLEFLGGFLYKLPPMPANVSPPLESSDETLQGGCIRITPWTTWKKGHANPLGMCPPNNAVENARQSSTDISARTSPAPPSSPASAVTDQQNTIVDRVSSPSLEPMISPEDSPIPSPRHTDAATLALLERLTSPSSSTTYPDADKEWPRRPSDQVLQRAGNWVRRNAAERRELLEQEMSEGVRKEVVEHEPEADSERVWDERMRAYRDWTMYEG
ncbi:hypothetical protein LTR37_009764 [Vermiconidia calcicola]|uniref:Uncharacterized protein n=1 Tax=Vermiconidia calcicola TaxID=1690605 RepID=A0ACC3N705_9PEZI|nr:hypothetical protein LTR37_009764 [Vermiconidia calcicola]